MKPQINKMAKNKMPTDKEVTSYGFYGIFGLVTYFIWCDLSFFGELAAEKTEELRLRNLTLISKNTIKLRMLDHFGHYLFLPFCKWTNEVFLISEIRWVTPNVITGIHFCIAIICGRLFASTILFVRRTAVMMFEIRSMLDIMDGVVYRAQMHSKIFKSGWGTWGYMIDGMADTLGGLFIMIGTLYRFNKYPPLKDPNTLSKLNDKYKASDVENASKLLISDDSCSEEIEELYGLKRETRKHVNLVTLFFTLTVIMRSALWDHFNHNYHNLMGVSRPDISAAKQAEVLNYGSTWFCIWLWKVNSADAFLQYTLGAIFFNKLWRWLKFWQYAAIPNMMIVGLICQFHLMQMRSLLGVSQ